MFSTPLGTLLIMNITFIPASEGAPTANRDSEHCNDSRPLGCNGLSQDTPHPTSEPIPLSRAKNPRRGCETRHTARARYLIQREASHTTASRSLRSLPRRMWDQLTQARAGSINAGGLGGRDYTVSPISCDLLLNILIQSVRLQVYQGIWEI